MSNPPVDHDPIFALEPEYRSAYSAIVNPRYVWAESRYLATRWGLTWALYPGGAATPPRASARKAAGRAFWVAVTFRQRIYRLFKTEQPESKKRPKGARPDVVALSTLAAESGLHRTRISEILDEPLFSWIVRRKTGEWQNDPATGKGRRATNTYFVRMDDPLVPHDAERLVGLWAEHFPSLSEDPVADALERLSWANARPAAFLQAPNLLAPLADPARYMGSRPLEMVDLLRIAVPRLTGVPAADPRWKQVVTSCQELADHITEPEKTVGGTHYFRQKHVPRLNPDKALVIVLLRQDAFRGADTLPVEDLFLEGFQGLAQRTGCSELTLQDWFQSKQLAGFAEVDPKYPHGRRGWDATNPQRVGYPLRVCMRDPLAPEDLDRYNQLVAAHLGDFALGDGRLSGHQTGSGPGPGGGQQTATGPKAPAQQAASGPKKRGTRRKADGMDSSIYSPPVDSPESMRGEASSSGLVVPSVPVLLARIHAGDDVPLPLWLASLGFHDPKRTELARRGWPHLAYLAWMLYAHVQRGSRWAAGWVIAQLRGDVQNAVPPVFMNAARLSPSRWVEFARAANDQRVYDHVGFDDPAERRTFDEWFGAFGHIAAQDLPYGLGVWAEEDEAGDEATTDSETDEPPEADTRRPLEEVLTRLKGVALWDAVLASLQRSLPLDLRRSVLPDVWAMDYDGATLRIGVRENTLAWWVGAAREAVEPLLRRFAGHDVGLAFEVAQAPRRPDGGDDRPWYSFAAPEESSDVLAGMTPEACWDRIKARLKGELNGSLYTLYVEATRGIGVVGPTILVEVPDHGTLNQLLSRVQRSVLDALPPSGEASLGVHYVVRPDPPGRRESPLS